jgi:hypothetical protein
MLQKKHEFLVYHTFVSRPLLIQHSNAKIFLVQNEDIKDIYIALPCNAEALKVLCPTEQCGGAMTESAALNTAMC